MNRLLLSFLFIAFANISTAQVADDFEYIDHKVRAATHGVSKVMGNDFIYVSHNQESWPMTSVIMVNTLDNSIDTILTTFASRSDIKEFPDGTFQIFISSLFDYDIVLPGFFSIEYDGATIDVDSILTYDYYNFDWDNFQFALDVAKSDDDAYYFNSYDNLLRLNSDETVDTLFAANYELRLHQNSNKKMYTYFGSELYELNDTLQNLLMDFGLAIRDIENNGDFNDVLLDGKLERWNIDFTQKIYELVLPEEIKTFYQLEVDSFMVTGLVQDGNKFTVNEYDLNGGESMLYENVYDQEGISGYHRLSDSKMLLIGNDTIVDADYSTLFFRNIDFNNEIQYQSRDVSMDSLLIYQFLKEDVFSYVNSQTGDSIFTTYYTTEIDLTFTNRSNEVIDFVDLRSSSFFSFSPFALIDYAYEHFQMMPGQSHSRVDTFEITQSLANLTYAIPGADFRFNNDPNRIIFPDFTSDVKNLVFDVDLKLYPNPTMDVLNIELDKEVQSLQIYNSVGQLVLYKSFGADLSRVDVSRLEAGSYFIKLRLDDEGGFATQQFVKMSR